ncbi:MAG TPA: ATP cone domain-containing protein, partial [Methylotenera sp.]|nr:ATP cone domain-containing protein [Methylotenera sp.]
MDDVRPSSPNSSLSSDSVQSSLLPMLQVIRRNGAAVAFNLDKISIAITKAFLAVEGNQSAASQRVRDQVATLSQLVNNALIRRLPAGGSIHIEDIQDQVELALMRNGNHDVARAYVLYREKRNAERAAEKATTSEPSHALNVNIDGKLIPLNIKQLNDMVAEACLGLGREVSADIVVEQAVRDLYDGIPFSEVYKALILSARSLIETEPAYNYVTARLQLDLVRAEVLGER